MDSDDVGMEGAKIQGHRSRYRLGSNLIGLPLRVSPTAPRARLFHDVQSLKFTFSS